MENDMKLVIWVQLKEIINNLFEDYFINQLNNHYDLINSH